MSLSGEQVGHTLEVCELRALVCSGPPRPGQRPLSHEHTYDLVDNVIPPTGHDTPGREEGLARLVERFVAGHGPVAAVDARRWCGVTLAEFDRATAVLGDRVEPVRVDGETLWQPTAPAPRTTRTPTALLLPVFDEVFLSYSRAGFPRLGTADRSRLFAQAGGGVVVVGLTDVGRWRRTVRHTGGGETVLEVIPEGPLTDEQRSAIEGAAPALSRFLSLPVRVEWQM